MTLFDDIPLPGLELEPRHEGVVTERRAYSNAIAPSAHTIDRFWSRVIRSPGCWLWVGAISGGDGYGRITWRRDGVSRTMSAHRFALLLAYGDDDSYTVGEHRCNEPLCVRVDDGHVIPSTQTANLRYAVACGRAGANRTTGDGRTRAQRSLAVRAAIRSGWDPVAYAEAVGQVEQHEIPTLF